MSTDCSKLVCPLQVEKILNNEYWSFHLLILGDDKEKCSYIHQNIQTATEFYFKLF